MKMPWTRYCSTLLYLVVIALFLLPVIPSFSAGYQEEKLFDGNYYTAEELRQKVEKHTNEIAVIDRQIKQLETEIDWLVLKINQIEDFERQAPSALKESIPQKEKKIANLKKTKVRLQSLLKHYSPMLNSQSRQNHGNASKNVKKEGEQPRPSSSSIMNPKINAGLGTDTYPAACLRYKQSGQFDQKSAITKTELEGAVQKADLDDWVAVTDTGACLRMKTTLPILFSSGSAKVSAEYNDFFKKLSQFLKSYDVKVLVNGYADNVPIHNEKYPSNFELGAARAANIVHQFVNNGLKPSIFSIESTGEHRFVSKQMSAQKSLERRAEVTIIFTS